MTTTSDVESPSGCYACEQNRALSLPVREEIHRSDTWRVAHAFDTDLPGWLVLVPTRHVLALTELTAEAAAELGVLLRSLSAALEAVTGCVKTYVMLLAEAEGFAHLHVHVVPRMAHQPASERGPRVFARLGRPPDERMDASALDEVAARIRQALGAL